MGRIIKSILFVCTGNTCRSPMAEGIMKKHLDDKGIMNVLVGSCGTAAFAGDSASRNSVLAVAEMGIDISNHRSRVLSQYLLNETDIVICMTSVQCESVKRLDKKVEVTVLGDGISDPYGGVLELYRETAEEIRDELLKLIDKLIESGRLNTNIEKKD